MVRKVELDLLEENDQPGPESSPQEGEPAKKGMRLRLPVWLTRKKMMVTAGLLAFSSIVVIAFLLLPAGKNAHVDNATELTEAGSTKDYVENLDGFAVDLKSEDGRYRVLVCDIAIVMNPDKKILENKVEVRKKTYGALKNTGKHILASPKAYGTIKKELRDELDGLLGGGVKEVYFTKFILL